MRKIQRRQLPERAVKMLAKRAKRTSDASDPVAEVARTWRRKDTLAWADIRAVLREMSTGLGRCMYCEDSAGTDIEHFYPKSAYPKRAYDWTNYLWACSHCNSNSKRDQFPLDDGEHPLLIDPTSQDPSDYLEFSPTTGKWVAKQGCREGHESIRVFGLTRFDQGRLVAWEVFQLVICKYGQLRDASKSHEAEVVLTRLRRLPFSGVLGAMMRLRNHPAAEDFLAPDVLAVLDRHPDVFGPGFFEV
jgi:uncharacterized protein (TIGR02646 family)